MPQVFARRAMSNPCNSTVRLRFHPKSVRAMTIETNVMLNRLTDVEVKQELVDALSTLPGWSCRCWEDPTGAEGKRRSASMVRRCKLRQQRRLPWPRIYSCPVHSARVSRRIRAAKGALLRRRSFMAWVKRSLMKIYLRNINRNNLTEDCSILWLS
jgi:hypothetical protein